MGDVQAAVLELLQRTPRHAELVSRLSGTIRRRNIAPDQIQQALTELQSRAAILIREHYCADPHLDNADLRVAAIIEPEHDSKEDPIAKAAEQIEAVWQRWLSEYLSNHTCV